MVPDIGAVVALVPVKAGIFPVPLAPKPIAVLLLLQLKVTAPVGPVVGVVKFTAAVVPPLHTVWLVTAFTTGVGLTVMVNVFGVPGQVIGAAVVYWNITLEILLLDGSCHILCGALVDNGNCMPILVVDTAFPAMVIPAVPSP